MSFWCLQFSQKTNENNSTWGTIVVKANFFVRFLGELKIPKRYFEINWPLAGRVANVKLEEWILSSCLEMFNKVNAVLEFQVKFFSDLYLVCDESALYWPQTYKLFFVLVVQTEPILKFSSNLRGSSHIRSVEISGEPQNFRRTFYFFFQL